MAGALHLNFDDAWEQSTLGLPAIDFREWGPRLRFSAPARQVEDFYRQNREQLSPFTLYGSGDFHHLTALWLRRCAEPVVVVSFDNHPDWDVRPPRWCCGGWVNRALELPQVRKVSVWGCGNFEYWWPGRFFGNRRAEREGAIEVHAWADGRSAKEQARRGAIFRANWREQFEQFLAQTNGAAVYVTIDLDCLRAGEAVTNWENGLFTIDDVAWALRGLGVRARIIGGDICGAFSVPKYARWKQQFVSQFDHPKLPPQDEQKTRAINRTAAETLWPLLVSHHS